MSSKTFFALAIQRLNQASHLGVRIKVKAASGTMLEIDVEDIKFDIQYCPAARVVEKWSDIHILPSDDPVFDLSVHALSKFQPYRDMAYLQRTIPDFATFRTAYRFIRVWAKLRGIYAAKFGYLGGIHIVLMLSCLCKLYFHDASIITAADIICTFFKHYSNFDWEIEILYDPFFFKEKPRYRRYPNESMVMLTLHSPVLNVARAVSAPSYRTIVEELKRADRILSQDNMTWLAICGIKGSSIDSDGGAHEFLEGYNNYIKINVQYWGLSLAKGSALVGWVESRCLRLLVDLDRKLPEIHTRIWPAKFTVKGGDVSADTHEYQGCYLIGLARRDTSNAEPMSKEKRRQAQDSLKAAVEQFVSQTRAEEKYFDASLAWVNATVVKQADVKDLVLDKREWGNHVVMDEVGDEDDDEAEEDEDLIDPDIEEALLSAKLKADKANKNRRQQKHSSAKLGKKLRPASDILSRLRWDPSFESAGYIIGYEDRFLGVMECP